MSDSTSLALLLELVSNPLMMSNFILYKYNREDLTKIAKDYPNLAEWIEDLGQTAETALKHLSKHGIPIDRLRQPDLVSWELLN